jgi:hypothetical protein
MWLIYLFMLNFVGCLEVVFVNEKYTLVHDESTFAIGSPYAVFFEGKWHSDLKLLDKKTKTGEDDWGSWKGTFFSWTVDGVPFETAGINYKAGIVVFRYQSNTF